jgi:L-asparaginase II
MNPILTTLTRGGRPESWHRGSIAVATRDGALFSAGDVATPVYPRSALKPFQALPLVEAGLDQKLGLTAAELTLTAASHSGDERHVEACRGLLTKGSIEESALLCGSHAPLDEKAARLLVREGRRWTVLHHNCSGKHTGMLIQARASGAPLENYVDPDHPVQRRIRARIAEFAGMEPEDLCVGIDGCSAPAFALPLERLARALARFAEPAGLEELRAGACRRLFDAITTEPHFLSGRRRFDFAVMSATHRRVLCKGGAEGVVALALRPPRPELPALGIAIKVEDGNARGYYRPALELLRWLGFDPPADEKELSASTEAVVHNYRGLETGRLVVGDVLATLPRSPWSGP